MIHHYIITILLFSGMPLLPTGECHSGQKQKRNWDSIGIKGEVNEGKKSKGGKWLDSMPVM